METRKKNEAAYHDHLRVNNVRKDTSKYYSVAGESRIAFNNFLWSDPSGKMVLEYGSSKGNRVCKLAQRGAKVIGIDISHQSLLEANRNVMERDMTADARFLRMDGEQMSFQENSFDLVFGTGILHHLVLERAYSEIARVLKPEGKAIFIEPLGHNPFINLYRFLTPKMRTDDEHPLLMEDLRLAERYFHGLDLQFFHLLDLLGVPLRGFKGFSKFLKFLSKVDSKIFKSFPLARRMAWAVVIILQKPKGIQKPAISNGEKT